MRSAALRPAPSPAAGISVVFGGAGALEQNVHEPVVGTQGFGDPKLEIRVAGDQGGNLAGDGFPGVPPGPEEIGDDDDLLGALGAASGHRFFEAGRRQLHMGVHDDIPGSTLPNPGGHRGHQGVGGVEAAAVIDNDEGALAGHRAYQ